MLERLDELTLMLGATVLTALNDNAAITYLASLVPGFGAESRYAVVAGAITGGGPTVIANAPNPAGQAILGSYESEFGEPWRDAEGADYNPETGIVTIFSGDGADGTPSIVSFNSELEASVPEPATLVLLGLGLCAFALRRARS